MVTMLNTSGEPIHPGDLVEWCFASQKGTHAGKRSRQGPRRYAAVAPAAPGATSLTRRARPHCHRFGITIASVSSPKVIGRALSFAKAGEQIDILLKQ